MNGMSQIFLDNVLFICGSPSSSVNSDEFTSSFLYSVDILQEPLKMKIEVNSCHPHYYPTLTILRNDILIAIGGLHSKHCEHYSISNKKWKELPDLIEERYGASALCDNKNNYIYVFGGLNNNTRKCGLTVFRLKLYISSRWDTMLVMENDVYLARMNSLIIKRDDRQIFILGGTDNNGNATDDVVNIDFNIKTIKPKVDANQVLSNKCAFSSLRHGIADVNGNIYAMDDSEDNYNVIYKISNSNCSVLYLNEKLH
jgi:hypothetical protein